MALNKILKAKPAAANLELWKSFSDFKEIVETEAGRFDLDIDVAKIDRSPGETGLFIYTVSKDGSPRGGPSACAAFPHTAQVKAGENRVDGALDRRAGVRKTACM